MEQQVRLFDGPSVPLFLVEERSDLTNHLVAKLTLALYQEPYYATTARRAEKRQCFVFLDIKVNTGPTRTLTPVLRSRRENYLVASVLPRIELIVTSVSKFMGLDRRM